MTQVAKHSKKHLSDLCKATQQKTIDLAKRIIKGTESLSIIEMNLRIEDTLSKPPIRSVFKGENAQISFSVVNSLCTRFINSFAFSSKLGPEQIEMLAVDTLDNFKYETLEDVILFFKMARSGKFGNTKRGVDSNLIFGEWYPMYLEKKEDIRQQLYIKNKNEQNSDVISLDSVENSYRKAQEKKEIAERKIKAQEFVDKISKDFDKQMLEDTILEWSKDPLKKYYTKLLKYKRITIK
jgi:hypothetical protein